MEKNRLLVYLYLFSLACGLSFLFVPLMKRLARRFGLLDRPGLRKVHQEAVPLLGGGAIVLSFMLVVAGNYFLFLWLGGNGFSFMTWFRGQYLPALALWPKVGLILIGALVIFGLGVLDDTVGVNFSFRLKFAIQFAVAGSLVMGGITIDIFPYPWLDKVVTVFWIVGITNAFNLLDNMDGLSSGVAILASVIFYIVACQHGQIFIALIHAA